MTQKIKTILLRRQKSKIEGNLYLRNMLPKIYYNINIFTLTMYNLISLFCHIIGRKY